MKRQSIRSTSSSGTSPASSVSSGRKSVQVILLNREELTVCIENKTRVQDVFTQTCDHLGLRETEYFGLTLLVEGEYQFQKKDTKLQKLLPKIKKPKSVPGDQPLLTFYFRVQFYVEHISLLKERVTRSQYYLQLRDNLLNHSQSVSEEKCFVIAANALQADYGDYTSRRQNNAQYFDPREYFPAWVVAKRGAEYLLQHTPTLHSDLRGLTKMEAQMNFIRDVSLPPVAHSLHFYKLKKRKTDELGSIWMGICAKGIEIYEVLEYNSLKSLLSTFFWPDIEKINHDKKKFELQTKDRRKFVYYTGSDEQSKYLFSLCQTTHQFHMSMQPKLAEIRHMEETDKRYRESYIYCDESSWEHERSSVHSRSSLHRGISGRHSPSSLHRGMSGRLSPRSLRHRVSMISNTSSNTTSGIVSDRHQASLDDSEEDCSQEIMITSPPMPDPKPWPPAIHSHSYRMAASASVPLLRPYGSHPSVCRSSSGRSQTSGRSQASVATAAVLAKLNSPLASTPIRSSLPKDQKVFGSPIPAETHVQRSVLPQTMIVSSRSVSARTGSSGGTSGVERGGYNGSMTRVGSNHEIKAQYIYTQQPQQQVSYSTQSQQAEVKSYNNVAQAAVTPQYQIGARQQVVTHTPQVVAISVAQPQVANSVQKQATSAAHTQQQIQAKQQITAQQQIQLQQQQQLQQQLQQQQLQQHQQQLKQQIQQQIQQQQQQIPMMQQQQLPRNVNVKPQQRAHQLPQQQLQQLQQHQQLQATQQLLQSQVAQQQLHSKAQQQQLSQVSQLQTQVGTPKQMIKSHQINQQHQSQSAQLQPIQISSAQQQQSPHLQAQIQQQQQYQLTQQMAPNYQANLAQQQAVAKQQSQQHPTAPQQNFPSNPAVVSQQQLPQSQQINSQQMVAQQKQLNVQQQQAVVQQQTTTQLQQQPPQQQIAISQQQHPIQEQQSQATQEQNAQGFSPTQPQIAAQQQIDAQQQVVLPDIPPLSGDEHSGDELLTQQLDNLSRLKQQRQEELERNEKEQEMLLRQLQEHQAKQELQELQEQQQKAQAEIERNEKEQEMLLRQLQEHQAQQELAEIQEKQKTEQNQKEKELLLQQFAEQQLVEQQKQLERNQKEQDLLAEYLRQERQREFQQLQEQQLQKEYQQLQEQKLQQQIQEQQLLKQFHEQRRQYEYQKQQEYQQFQERQQLYLTPETQTLGLDNFVEQTVERQRQIREVERQLQQLHLQETTAEAGYTNDPYQVQLASEGTYQYPQYSQDPAYTQDSAYPTDVSQEWEQLSQAASRHEEGLAYRQTPAYYLPSSSGSGDSNVPLSISKQQAAEMAELLKHQHVLMNRNNNVVDQATWDPNARYTMDQFMMGETHGSTEALDTYLYEADHAPTTSQQMYYQADVPELVRPDEQPSTAEILAPPYGFHENQPDYELPSNTGYAGGQDPASVYAALNNVAQYGASYPESIAQQPDYDKTHQTDVDTNSAAIPTKMSYSEGPKLPSYLSHEAFSQSVSRSNSKQSQDLPLREQVYREPQPNDLPTASPPDQQAKAEEDLEQLNSTVVVTGEDIKQKSTPKPASAGLSSIEMNGTLAFSDKTLVLKDGTGHISSQDDDSLVLVHVPRGRKWCPKHSVNPHHMEEVRAKNLSMPMVSALLNAKDLSECRCHINNDDTEPNKRKSYAHPAPEPMWNEPGTVARPVSWHFGNFTPEQTLSTLKELNIGEVRGAQAQDPFHSEVGEVRVNGLDLTALTGSTNKDSSGSPSNSSTLVPSKLNSGGHSPHNSDSHVATSQKASLGVA